MKIVTPRKWFALILCIVLSLVGCSTPNQGNPPSEAPAGNPSVSLLAPISEDNSPGSSSSEFSDGGKGTDLSVNENQQVPPGASRDGEEDLHPPASQIVYKGNANINLTHYDFCDLNSLQRRYAGEQSSNYPVTLNIGPSLMDSAGLKDPNPFRFSFATDQQGPDGTFGIQSSYYGVISQGSGRDILLTYWTFTYDPQTGAIDGMLTDGHGDSAAALNVLFSADTSSCGTFTSGIYSLADANNVDGYQTAITGTITDFEAHLQIFGSTSGGGRDFMIDAILTRQ